MQVKFSTILATTSLLLGLQACGKNDVIKDLTGGDDNKPAERKEIFGEPLALTAIRDLAAKAPLINTNLKNYASCEALQADLNKTLELEAAQARANLAMQIKNSLEYEIWAQTAAGRADKASAKASNEAGAPQASQAPTAGGAVADAKNEAGDFTNIQEKGVDEADRFRIGKEQIFSVGFDKLQVVDRASLKHVGTLKLEANSNPQLYTRGDKLIVVENAFEKPKAVPANEPAVDVAELALTSPARPAVITDAAYPGYYGGSTQTRVRIFQTKAGAMPELLRDLVLDGGYVDSRLIQSRLVVVMNDQMEFDNKDLDWNDFAQEEWFKMPRAKELFDQMKNWNKARTLKIVDGALAGVPCESIAERKVQDFDLSLSKTVSLDVDNDKADVNAVASIGQGDQIYVTSDSVYLLKYRMQWFGGGWFTPWNWTGTTDEKTYVRQLALSADGKLAIDAEGEVPGRIKDRWALSASGGNLRIATSTGQLWSSGDKANIAQNHLFVLGKEAGALKVIGSVRDFGTHEDIRSVRYIGTKAYIVTFKQIDPLFSFDLSDATAPKLLSGLKVPGFSTYMHPLTEGLMLGVGFDAIDLGHAARPTGIQVSLFDISNPLDMSRVDNHIYGDYGSSSEVTSNHHAFFYDAESALVGMPLTERLGGQVSNGALILGLEQNKLVEKARISHSDLIPDQCEGNFYGGWGYQGQSVDVNRVYKVDGKLLTISRFGLKAYGLDNLKKATATTSFQATCQQNGYYPY